MKPVFIHLDILWEKNKDTQWEDFHTTPYMFDNKDSYYYHLEAFAEEQQFKNDVETIEYWTEFYKKATFQDMLDNQDSWIMVCMNSKQDDDFVIYDGFHRLTGARLARKDIIVATFDIGPYKQGKDDPSLEKPL
jgi:hypothetical protein